MSLFLFRKLARPALASYAVRVPRTGALPQDSFRFHLTMDALAFG